MLNLLIPFHNEFEGEKNTKDEGFELFESFSSISSSKC